MTASVAAAQFDIGRVINRTFTTIGRNFTTFLILSLVLEAVPTLVFSVLQVARSGLAAATATPSYSSDPTGALLNLLGTLVTALAGLLVQAALIRGTFADLSGKRASLGQLLSTGVQFILPLFGLGIVMGLGLALGFLLFIVPGCILLTMWLVTGPAIVVERKGVFESFGRSSALTQGSRWSIFGLIVIFVVAVLAVDLVFGAGMLASLFGGGTSAFIAVSLVVSAVLSALVSMVSSVGVASVYFELRSIKDGVGAEALASVFD